MENHTIVTLKKGEGRTIKAGGAWILIMRLIRLWGHLPMEMW